ncbi:MAG: aminotransferase class I/II-fold pyridoxal phosphate-dependent enzyme [Reyranella sp.]|uniref:aminotransferase class I/II-fold pyridoxal phosphate-dependent enzyme n=1 Tax=Reyranella sp. TaxID=1929291 RepID=UPI002731B03D|nr:aminotransferase class I/II-fold pyridoxal phosphate-dependent enzyme [Reyranella sp.]MDP1967453.1 aminotransferase class I/II-fold pyridoxal phosphate-dependent enzyme [Reyranella sp.]MDP2376431.1 aminotransferase class I/II-fold pyridoxal phosphate-dependent enzyme [Reyranella sp.]
MTAYNPAEAQATIDRVRRVLKNPPVAATRQSESARTGAKSGGRDVNFATLPEYEVINLAKAVGHLAGLEDPYFRLHDGLARETTSLNGRQVVNFSSYDYLGLNGHPDVVAAAKAAIDQYGTSVSASRLTAGERQVHRDLEAALARIHDAEAAISFVSGHATNVSVIGGLLGPEDLIVTDVSIHNSVTEGAKLSGAKRILCPHGDLEAIERALRLNRSRYRRTLIVVEGLYGMDGDVPDLAQLIKLKRRYSAWLMVDEAHSLGVLGATGRGIAEEQDIDPSDVDIWMGTLSKTLVAAGGYIAGARPLIELLKFTSPSFVYSVGTPPPVAAAATAALGVMQRESWRLKKLRQNGRNFAALATARGLDIGLSIGASIIPVIVGSSPHAVILSQRLLERGYNLFPAIFPGVAENQARLRFFMTSRHSIEQIEGVIDAIATELPGIRSGPSFVNTIAGIDV